WFTRAALGECGAFGDWRSALVQRPTCPAGRGGPTGGLSAALPSMVAHVLGDASVHYANAAAVWVCRERSKHFHHRGQRSIYPERVTQHSPGSRGRGTPRTLGQRGPHSLLP